MGEINFDTNNEVTLEDLKIGFTAIADKIIVLYDTYKSGYECELCKGKGKITKQVYKVVEEDGAAWVDEEIVCTKCEGKQALLIIPEISKSLPSTGRIVSVGPLCKLWSPPTRNTPGDIGTHVVFAPHVGTFLPMKGNIKLKIMREHEPLCALRYFGGGEDVHAKDFIDYESPIE